MRDSLINAKTVARIISRSGRVELGNYGDAKSVGEGVKELRYTFGAGYRVYKWTTSSFCCYAAVTRQPEARYKDRPKLLAGLPEAARLTEKGSIVATYRKFRDVIIERFQEDPEEAHAYLQVALEDFEEDGDTEYLLLALRTVAEAQGGVPELARRIDMEKMTLYKALSEKGNPRLSTVYAILRGLGYKLRLEPQKQPA